MKILLLLQFIITGSGPINRIYADNSKGTELCHISILDRDSRSDIPVQVFIVPPGTTMKVPSAGPDDLIVVAVKHFRAYSECPVIINTFERRPGPNLAFLREIVQDRL